MQVGEQISVVNPGTWTGRPPPSLRFAWTRDGTAIAGETGARYTLVEADVGCMISATVIAENSAGSASASTSPVGPITA
jgi:hypothetical protein